MENQLKAEMRLTAIEYVLCDLAAKILLLSGGSKERIEDAHKKLIDELKTQTFPGLDPALGDLASSELEEAVSSLLLMQREMTESLRRESNLD